MFSLEIPLQLDFTETKTIPVIMTGFGSQEGLKIASQMQKFSDFVYLKDGIFHRKQVIFTKESQIGLAFPVMLNISTEGLKAAVTRNTVSVQDWSGLTNGSYCETSLSLQTGINHFQIVIEGVNALYYAHKPMKLQFSVYKFP